MHFLSQHFPALDEATLVTEWNQFKFIPLPSTINKSIWDFYYPYRTTFPELWKLVQLLLIIPANTAACERGFSKLKIVKTDRRNRLSSEQLNNLITISLSKPSQEDDVLVSLAVNVWRTQSTKTVYFIHK